MSEPHVCKGSPIPVTVSIEPCGSASAPADTEGILAALPAAAYTCDGEGRITAFNAKAAAIWGRAPRLNDGAELYCGSYRLHTPDGRSVPHDRCWMAVALKEGKRVAGREIVIEQPGGGRIAARAHATPFFDEAGDVVGGLNVLEDISAERRLEEELAQSRKLETLGLMAGGVAHDFNNLLTVISGYSEYLLSCLPADTAAREIVGDIRHAAERAASLTRQLLSFSHRHLVTPRAIDVNETVAATEKMLRRIIGEDIALRCERDDEAGSVWADPTQVEQVILNLALNARDAMPTGGTLTIATARGEREGVRGAYLSVTDTGVGMNAEIRSRVFEPFFTTKAAGIGTGLGLATVHGIVGQCKGHIDVRSEPGAGSRFTVFFPAADPDGDAEAVEGVEEAPKAGTETILLVEDEAGVRKMVKTVLERQGYKVLDVCNGREAYDTLMGRPGKVHLVLTDVVMPEMGGRQLIERLRAEGRTVPVLYMSGYVGEGMAKDLDGRTESFIQKPFTSRALLHTTRAFLDRAG